MWWLWRPFKRSMSGLKAEMSRLKMINRRNVLQPYKQTKTCKNRHNWLVQTGDCLFDSLPKNWTIRMDPCIWTDNLQIRRMNANFVPRLLTDQELSWSRSGFHVRHYYWRWKLGLLIWPWGSQWKTSESPGSKKARQSKVVREGHAYFCYSEADWHESSSRG